MDLSNGMRFSPHKRKCRTTCYALGCKSCAQTDFTLRFHALPKSGQKVQIVNKLNQTEMVDRRTIWIKRLKINRSCDQATVCSLHFTKNDYIESPYAKSKLNLLKKTAVPSLNLPPDSPKTQRKKEKALIRAERAEKRACQKELYVNKTSKVSKKYLLDAFVSNEEMSVQEMEIDNPISDENEFQQHVNTGEENVENRCEYIQVNVSGEIVPEKNMIDKSVQVQFDNLLDFTSNVQDSVNVEAVPVKITCEKSVQIELERYKEFITNEKQLTSMTGLGSFDLLDLLEKIVLNAVPKMELHFCKQSCQLSIKDRIILSFIKLKQNLEYSSLSGLFKLKCEWTCRAIFLRMIRILSASLQFAIYWPSKTEILKNIPKCFEQFSNVRAVIDGIEFHVEKPKKTCCQSDVYSSYKSSYTVKFITAVSPGGLITFVSEPYPGRTSDKVIFEQSKLIGKFDKNDAVMVDKGFLIDDICIQHEIQLIRPPFLKNKVQFSREETTSNSEIAKARVHIERCNQRIKVFKILSTKIPSYLVGRIDQILTIICAIVNLSDPILSDDKFISH